MAIFIRKIKTFNWQKTLSIVLLAGLSAMALSILPAKAVGPEFNIFPIDYSPTNPLTQHDLPLLDAKNLTSGSGDWAQETRSVTAGPGDTIGVQIFYHNGVPDDPANTAINAIAQAFLSPAGLAANSFVVSANLGAENASSVNSASKGGNININVTGSQPQTLTLVPGSVKHLPNRATSSVQLPDSIFSGVNLGSIRGCWEFAGFVNFKLQVSNNQPPAEGNFTITKTVRNVTQNVTTFSSQTTARLGELVEFRIVVTAQGGDVHQISARDFMDPGLTLSSPVTVNVNGQNFTLNSTEQAQFFAGGPPASDLPNGQSRIITFQAQVASSGLTSGQVLTNRATAFTPAASQDASASVVINVPQQQPVVCTFTWEQPTDSTGRGLRRPNDPDTALAKSNVQMFVQNLQPNQSFSLVDQHISGAPVFEDIKTADAQGNFGPLTDRTIITSNFTAGEYNVFVKAGGVNVAICKGFVIQAAPVRTIHILKQVQNDSAIGSFGSSVQATPGQILTFKIVVDTNGSNTSVPTVIVKDQLPAKLIFNPGSLIVDGINKSDFSNAFFTSGINIGEMAANTQKEIRFQVTVASGSNFNIGCPAESLQNVAVVEGVNTFISPAATIGPFDSSATVLVCKEGLIKQPGSPGNRPSF